MELYKCMHDGNYSLSNQDPCDICNRCDWEPMDPALLSDDEWEILYEQTEGVENEYAIVEEWAKTGNPEARKTLAMMLMNGNGCKKDEKRAFDELESIVEKNRDPSAIFLLGCCYLSGGLNHDPVKGLSLLWHARDMKFAEATWTLAKLYEAGGYVGQDKKKSMKLYKQSAEQGSEQGMRDYGVRLFSSAKSEKEMEAGLSWLWRSARCECGEAQATLGYILGKIGSPVYDYDQALYWLERAVDNETEDAAATYASVWMNNQLGCFSNSDRAYDIANTLEEALERGETSAAWMLGEFSRKGICGPVDFEKAFKYYRMGQGHDAGCTAGVAHCYLYGLGTEKNPSLAHLILSDLIDVNGDLDALHVPEDALIDMGDMYRDGNGTKQDSLIAAKLYASAASREYFLGAARLCQEALKEGTCVSGLDAKTATEMLLDASEEGDFDSSFFLIRHYLSFGDRKNAALFVHNALGAEQERLDKPATKLAEKEFPDLLKNHREYKDLFPDSADESDLLS